MQDGYQIQIEATTTFLIIFGYCKIILIIIKVRILVLDKWSYITPQIMSTTDLRMLIKFWVFSQIQCFLALGFRDTLNRKPLKYRCLIEISNWTRHTYLIWLHPNVHFPLQLLGASPLSSLHLPPTPNPKW